jgi:ubiquinone/menaquinone biosynthesis C-methylase UbiE
MQKDGVAAAQAVRPYPKHGNQSEFILMAQHRVCPWWVGYLLVNPLRRLMQDPAAILKPYVRLGTTVLEPGPGMGVFTLELARLVGPSGHVIALDVEPRMVEGLKRRAKKAGLLDRIDARAVPANSMALGDLPEKIDFVLAAFVVHEMPAASKFFAEAAKAMKAGATLLLMEPAGHVSEAEFEEQLTAAAAAGLRISGRLSMRGCQAALLQKP